MTDLQKVYREHVAEQIAGATARLVQAKEELETLQGIQQNDAPTLDVDKSVFTVKVTDPYDNYYNRHTGEDRGPVYPTRTGRGLIDTFKTVLGDEWHSAYKIKPTRVTVTLITNDLNVPVPEDLWLPLVDEARVLARG